MLNQFKTLYARQSVGLPVDTQPSEPAPHFTLTSRQWKLLLRLDGRTRLEPSMKLRITFYHRWDEAGMRARRDGQTKAKISFRLPLPPCA